MLFTKDSRYRAGGYYRCRAKHREGCQKRRDNAETYARYLQQQRDRYDNDPVYRISKRLMDDARSRRKTIERRRALDGEVSQ